MTKQKEMTKAEIQDALECFVKHAKEKMTHVACASCVYADFCWDLGKAIEQKPKKYIRGTNGSTG